MRKLCIPARVEAWERVSNFLKEALEEAACSPKLQLQILVAAEETFVNIAHYAYGTGEGEANIALEVGGEPRMVRLWFSDRGVPYNPLDQEEPDVGLSAEEREIGGLGIFMTRKMMDELYYRYEDGCNILEMRKMIPHGGQQMLYCLKELCKDLSLKPEQTPYAAGEGFWHTQISSGTFYARAALQEYLDAFPSGRAFLTTLKRTREERGAEATGRALEHVKSTLIALGGARKRGEAVAPEELVGLRARKKVLTQKLKEQEEAAMVEASRACWPNGGLEGQEVLLFKEFLLLQDYEQAAELLPALKHPTLTMLAGRPVFSYRLNAMRQRLINGESVAITGGPCLFGRHEVDIHIRLVGGQEYTLDYSSGRNYEEGEAEEGASDVESLLYTQSGRIEEIDFTNHKHYLSGQEFESLYYLFSIANGMNYSRGQGARLAIPIPDGSYLKYLRALCRRLPPGLSAKALAAYARVTDEICDLYLDRIQAFRAEYPELEVAVLHRRDQRLWARFETARAPFFQKESWVRGITNSPTRFESVLDYVSMPALPYYLWGSTGILDVDSLDECDSLRKCHRAHKSCLELFGLMYPERISGDGENTIFNADRGQKEYGIERR